MTSQNISLFCESHHRAKNNNYSNTQNTLLNFHPWKITSLFLFIPMLRKQKGDIPAFVDFWGFVCFLFFSAIRISSTMEINFNSSLSIAIMIYMHQNTTN